MSKVKPLYIIEAGDFGREVVWLVERINKVFLTWDFRGFIDDDNTLWNTQVDGYKVHGGHGILEQSKEDVWCVLAVGNWGRFIRKNDSHRLPYCCGVA